VISQLYAIRQYRATPNRQGCRLRKELEETSPRVLTLIDDAPSESPDFAQSEPRKG